MRHASARLEGFESLAQSGAGSLLLWIGVLGAVVVVGGVLVLRVRRRTLAPPAASEGGAFALHELRAMRAEGRISEEEFARLRDAALRGAGVDPNGARQAPTGVDLAGRPLPGADGSDAGASGNEPGAGA